ncbi:MAG: SAF domain-containing protein [Acidimicrobiales bacterium]
MSTTDFQNTPTQVPVRRRRSRPRPFNAGYMVSILLAVVAGVVVLATGRAHTATRLVPVATRAVPAGTKLSAADVRTMTMTATDAAALAGLLTPAEVVGRVAAEPIAAGQPFTAPETRFGQPAGAGLGQMSLAVPALDADAANITAGDYVDVVESGATGAVYVAQRVLVLSASSGPSSSSPLGVGGAGNYYLVLAVGKQTGLHIAGAIGAGGTNSVQVILSNNEEPVATTAPTTGPGR